LKIKKKEVKPDGKAKEEGSDVQSRTQCCCEEGLANPSQEVRERRAERLIGQRLAVYGIILYAANLIKQEGQKEWQG